MFEKCAAAGYRIKDLYKRIRTKDFKCSIGTQNFMEKNDKQTLQALGNVTAPNVASLTSACVA